MANNTTTINKIILMFQDIANRHQMINQFSYGPLSDINTEGDFKMPYLHIENTNSTLSKGNGIDYRESYFDFDVYVMDRINKGDNNYIDTTSDTLYILHTIVAEIDQHPYYVDAGLLLINDVTTESVFEATDDNVNGHRATLRFKQAFRYTPCTIPINEIPGWTFSLNGSISTLPVSGAQGPQGPQGEIGPQGVTGTQGLNGLNGATGPQGATGSEGPQGATGSEGPQGLTGPQGNQGFQGLTGPQGNQGFQGPTGADGSAGTQGPTGPIGSAGAQGPTGPAGSGSGLTGSGVNTRIAFWNGTQSLSSSSGLIWDTSAGLAQQFRGLQLGTLDSNITFSFNPVLNAYTNFISSGGASLRFTWNGGSNGVNRAVSLIASGGASNHALSIQLLLCNTSINASTTNAISLVDETVNFNKELNFATSTRMLTQTAGRASLLMVGSGNDTYPRFSNFAGASSKYYHIPVIPTTSNGNTASTGFAYSANTGDLFTQTTSVTVGNTSSETSLISGTIVGSKDLVASTNTINPHFVVGKRYRFNARGTIKTAASAGVLTIRTTIGGTTICSGSASLTNSIPTGSFFEIDTTLTIRSVGASGAIVSSGLARMSNLLAMDNIQVLNSGATVSTTSNRTFDVTAQWGTTSVDNTITILEASLEQIDPTERSLGVNINGITATIKTT